MNAGKRRVLVERGERALADHAADQAALRDPLLPAVVRYLDEAKGGRRDRAALLRRWQGNPVHRTGERRYPWTIAWDDYPDTRMKWARRPGQDRVLWRPLEEAALRREPTSFAGRLTLPIILTEALEFLDETTESDPGLALEAGALRDQVVPKIEADYARYVTADDAWGDTFALWRLTRHRRALERLDPLAIATATRFAARARMEEDVVRGTEFPFFEQPLASASAHLAAALWTLGIYPTLIPRLLAHLRCQQRPDGGWGDPGQPSDVLTTLAVADVLAHLDPGFTLEASARPGAPGEGGEAAQRVVDFFGSRQEAAGWWRALDPETPWLTAEVCRWLHAIGQPFPARFRWPRLARWQRDRKTRVPLFAFYEDLATAAGQLGPLGEATVEVAFMDLIGFGRWNKEHGQRRGDELLAAYSEALREIPDSLVVRDGGDEFLVIGKPGLSGVLQGRLEAFSLGWPGRCQAALPDAPPVLARMVLAQGAMRDALPIRAQLGKAVGEIAAWEPDGPEGVMGTIDASGLTVVHGRRR